MRNKVPLLLLVAAVLTAALHLGYLWTFLASPEDTTMPESQTVYIAHRFARGESIYPDYHHYPYNIAPYTPAFYLLLGFLSRVAGAGAEQMFLIGRALSYASALVIASVLYLLGTIQSKSRGIGTVSACLFLGSYVLWPWAVSSRSDLLALLFTTSGLALYISRGASVNGSVFAALFFLLAFFSKQSYLVAPAAVFFDMLFRKRKSEAIVFSLLMLLPAMMILGWMHFASGGLSTMNIFYGNIAPLRFSTSRLLFSQFLQFAPVPLILAAAGCKANSWRHPLSLYWTLSLLWALFTSSKVGSNINYFLQPLLASCLLVPAGLNILIQNLTPKIKPAFSALVLVLFIPPINFLSSSRARVDQSPAVLQMIRESQGPVLTDNSRFALFGPDSFMIDPFQLSFLEKSGNWNSNEIGNMLEKGEIRWIVLKNPMERGLAWQGVKRIPESIIERAKREYHFHGMIDGYYVYKPK